MGTKNAKSTSTMTPPSWVSSAYQNLFSNAGSTASQPYTPYTGGFTSDQQTAFQNIGNLAGSASPAFNAANSAFTGAMTPSYQNVQSYMNPYTSGVVNATMANMQEMNARQQQDVLGNAISKGAMGGNRVGVAQAELARQQNLANQQTIAGLWNDNYSQALGAAQNQQQVGLQGGANLANLGQTQMQTNLGQAAAQLGAGTQQQQFDYQQYLNKLAFPYQQQSWLASLVGGIGPNAGGTTTEEKPQGNIFSQLIGGALGVASMFKNGGVVPHAAGGGVMPYANDNAQWPGIGAMLGGSPYASNDNAPFASYVPEPMQINGGSAAHFPTISPDDPNATDPLSDWSKMASLGEGRAYGGVVRPHYADGGVMPRGGSMWDNIVNMFGSRMGQTPIGRMATKFAPQQWEGMGRFFRGLDDQRTWSNPWSQPRPSNGTPFQGKAHVESRPSSGSVLGVNALVPTTAMNGNARRMEADGGVVPSGFMWQGRERSSNVEDRRHNTRYRDGFYPFDGVMPYDPFTQELQPEQHFIRAEERASGGVVPHMAGGGIPWTTQAFGQKLPAQFSAPVMGSFEALGMSDEDVLAVALQKRAEDQAMREARLPPGSATIDTTNPMVAENLGLGMGNGTESNTMAYDAGLVPDASVENFPPSVRSAGLIPSGPIGNTVGVVPYGQGDQFMTNPAPSYSQNIGDAFRSIGEGKGLNLSPDVRQALLAAGMGMMASKSPFALQGIGEGGLKGIDVWNTRQGIERENATARANIGQTGEGLALQAAQTAANIPLVAAQTGATRYTFTSTPAGVQVTDAQNPTAVRFVPWGGVLPDGTLADKDQMTKSGLLNAQPETTGIDPRLMAPSTVPLVTGETASALEDARPLYQSASAANQQLEEMLHNFDNLPETGWLSPGSDFTNRLYTAKAVNTGLQMMGLQPIIDEKQVAAGEDLNKLTTRLGFELSKGVGSNAAQIVTDAVSAVPSGANSREGAERIIAALKAVNQRQIDHYLFLQEWSAKNSGSIRGADESFNRQNPPELYALSAYVPFEAMLDLKKNPDLASDFNAMYGNGRDVARYVLAAGG